jgi:hypothetical protein
VIFVKNNTICEGKNIVVYELLKTILKTIEKQLKDIDID